MPSVGGCALRRPIGGGRLRGTLAQAGDIFLTSPPLPRRTPRTQDQAVDLHATHAYKAKTDEAEYAVDKGRNDSATEAEVIRFRKQLHAEDFALSRVGTTSFTKTMEKGPGPSENVNIVHESAAASRGRAELSSENLANIAKPTQTPNEPPIVSVLRPSRAVSESAM